MSAISEKLRTALFGKMNVSGVTTLCTGGVHFQQAPESAALPYILFSRQAPGTVEWNFGFSQGIEDDLWLVKVLSDEDSNSSYSPQSLNAAILSAAETAIGTAITLSGATVIYCKRWADIPDFGEQVNDRIVWQSGFLLRVVAN